MQPRPWSVRSDAGVCFRGRRAHSQLPWLLLLLLLGGCSRESSSTAKTAVQAAAPEQPDASTALSYEALLDRPLEQEAVLALRWSYVLFEDEGAPQKAFPQRLYSEPLKATQDGQRYTFELQPPAPDYQVFSGLCAGFGGEMCSDAEWTQMEQNPRYALAVLTLIAPELATCTFSSMSAGPCAEQQPLAVSRHLLLYVYAPLRPAEDPFLAKKWPWELGEQLEAGFHVVDFESKRSARLVQTKQLELNVGARMPNLF